MKFMKKITAWLLTLMLLMSLVPSTLIMTAFAAQFEDFPTGWSREAVQAAVDNGLIQGKTNGKLEPESNLTRAEAATIINRAFGSTVKADISSFVDVNKSDWFYEEMAKAVNMKTFVGDGSYLHPDDNITREEMFTVIARALVLSDHTSSALNKFTDSSDVSSYAVPYLTALAENGYINGNPDGTLLPKAYITREEFAQVMHNIFKTYISKPGTYTSVGSEDSVIIRTGGVTLKNVTIEKDLVLGDGVGAGDIKLENVTIKGRLLCRGGEGKVHLVKTTVGDRVVVYDVNGTVNFNNYRDEAPFKNIVENTPATFLEKKTSGGGSSSSKSYKEYTVEVYFQNDLVEDGTSSRPARPEDPVMYGGKDTAYDKTIRETKNAQISLSWADINDLYGSTADWDIIKKKYQLDTAMSVLEGKNDGKLVLKVYLKKNIFTVEGPGGPYYYYYGEKLSDNPAYNKYVNDYINAVEPGYNPVMKDGSGKDIDGDYVVTKDITFTLDKETITYYITYDSKGGSPIAGSQYTEFTVESEFKLPIPSKAGYEFVAWHNAADDSVITEIKKGTIGDISVYAEWKELGDDYATYKLEVYFDERTSADVATPNYNNKNADYDKSLNDLKDASITLTWSDIDGIYDAMIADWDDVKLKYELDTAKSELNGTNNGSLVLKIYLKKKVFKVTADGTTYNFFYGEKLGSNDAFKKFYDDFANDQVDAGYNVTWKDAGNNDVDLDYEVKEDASLTFIKEAITYHITYDSKGGSAITDTRYTEFTVESEFKLPTPTRGGYKFVAWHNAADDSVITEIKKGTIGDISVYAEWEKLGDNYATYNLEVYFDERTSADVATPNYGNKNADYNKTLHDLKDASITLTWSDIDGIYSADISNWDDVKLSYELDTDKSALSGKNDGELVIKIYLKKKVFKVTDTNGDTYNFFYDEEIGSNKAFETYYNNYNETWEGYDIVWKDSDGNVVDLGYKVTKDVTLTTDLQVIEYTLTYVTQMAGFEIAPVKFTVNDEVTLEVPGVTNGYVFAGWYTNAALTGNAITKIEKGTTNDVTVYAKWDAITNQLLSLEASKTADQVFVNVKLSDIPQDISDLSLISITYTYDDTKLDYVTTEIKNSIGGSLNAAAGSITWTGTLTTIPADELLFTITFDIKERAHGEAKFEFVAAELKDSTGTASSAYDTEDGSVELGDARYIVKLYIGVEKKVNLIDQIEDIPANSKLNPDDVYDIMGRPEDYAVEGYTNSDGAIHYIVPELMYNNNGTWEVFDFENTLIDRDLSLCLLSKKIKLSISPERTFKGINLGEYLNVEVTYDSESSIGESTLDALTETWKQLDTLLYVLESEKGINFGDSLIARLSAKGITDETGAFIAKDVSLKMADYLSAKQIEGKIDEYIEENLNDDEFIASLLENESILNQLLGNDEIKKSFMNDADLRKKLLSNEEFIKDMASDSTIVDKIIASEEFRKSFINNDATFDYIMKDEEIKTKILNDANFRKILIDECIKLVIDVYFEETKTAPELYNYIDSVLMSDEFIKDIESKPELKTILADEIKNLIKNADNTVKEELFNQIRGSGTLKDQIIEEIKTNPDISAAIKTTVKNSLLTPGEIRTRIIAVVKQMMQDDADVEKDVRDAVKKALASDGDLKEEIVDVVKDMMNGDANIKTDIMKAVKDAFGTDAVLKNAVIEVVEDMMANDAAVKAEAIAALQDALAGDDVLKGKVKESVKSLAKDDIRDYVKTWILNNIETDAAIKDEIIEYIKANDDILEKALEKEDPTLYDQYLLGNITLTDPDVVNAINEQLGNVAKLKELAEENFNAIYDANFEDLCDKMFDKFYTDADIFGVAFDKFLESDSANLTTVFDEYINVPANFEKAFNKFLETDEDNFVKAFDKFINNDANFKKAFDKFITINNGENFGKAFDKFITINNGENFDRAYNKFVTDEDNFRSAFDEYISDNTKLEDAFEKFVANGTAFDEFYNTYVGDDARFNELFEKYYPTHVHDVAKSAYNNPNLKGLVDTYIKDYTEDLALEYASDELSVKHPDLVDTINKIMADDMPAAIRAEYAKETSDVKDIINDLITSNAETLITKYVNDQLNADEKDIINDAIADYADEVAKSYIDGTIDDYTKDFVDAAIEDYVRDIVDDFVNGVNRDDVRDLIMDYAEDAVKAFKESDAYIEIINVFKNKEDNFVITADNLVIARGIASAVDSYTYEQIKNDFVDERLHKLLDVVGDKVFEKYVKEATDNFVIGLNEICDKVDADVANGIMDSQYTYPARLHADVNVISEILYPVYNKAMEKAKAKIPNLPADIKYDENPYLQRLVNTNLLDELFFDKKVVNGETVYSLKTDVSQIYKSALDLLILSHDAIVWYGEEYGNDAIDAKASAAAFIIAGYTNKLNDVIMNYIENGELPGDITLEKIFDINGRIEPAYERVDQYIDKLLAKYEEYLDRDYEVVFEKLVTGTITANGEQFDALDIAIETKIFDVDDMFDAALGGHNFADNRYVNKVVNVINSKKYSPESTGSEYYIDAYKKTLNSKSFKGYSTGDISFKVDRYLK